MDKTIVKQTVLETDTKQPQEKVLADKKIGSPPDNAIALPQEEREKTNKALLPLPKTDQKRKPEKIEQPVKKSVDTPRKDEPDIQEKAALESKEQSKDQGETTANTKKVLISEKKTAKKDGIHIKNEAAEKKASVSVAPNIQQAPVEKEITKTVEPEIRDRAVPEMGNKTEGQRGKITAEKTDPGPLAGTEEQSLPIRQTTSAPPRINGKFGVDR